MPYGGAPEWSHTSGDGLSGTLPTGIDPTFTIAGFVRIEGSAGDGTRYVWYGLGQQAGLASHRAERQTALSFTLRLDGQTINDSVDSASTRMGTTWRLSERPRVSACGSMASRW